MTRTSYDRPSGSGLREALERIVAKLNDPNLSMVETIEETHAIARDALSGSSDPDHAPDRIIGYTAFECERDMQKMGMHCANPEEHRS